LDICYFPAEEEMNARRGATGGAAGVGGRPAAPPQQHAPRPMPTRATLADLLRPALDELRSSEAASAARREGALAVSTPLVVGLGRGGGAASAPRSGGRDAPPPPPPPPPPHPAPSVPLRT
jgi:hypothetical protein